MVKVRRVAKVAAVAAFATVLLSGCGVSVPADPQGTLERVQGGTLRVGATEQAPWVELEASGAAVTPTTGTDPAASETADPAPSDPAPTGPAPTGPAPTGPAPTGPAPTGPAPTGPEPTGIEPILVEEFAAQLGADVAWTTGSEAELLDALERGELDVVVGGFLETTPWTERGAATRPYAESRSSDGMQRHVMLVRLGENGFQLELERFLHEETGE